MSKHGEAVKIAIIGSRNFSLPKMVEQFVDNLPVNTTVVSGGARGVDTIAANRAKVNGLTVEIYYADWARLGKAAGYIRNKYIIDAADEVMAFWDGRSPGTKHAISLAVKANKPMIVLVP